MESKGPESQVDGDVSLAKTRVSCTNQLLCSIFASCLPVAKTPWLASEALKNYITKRGRFWFKGVFVEAGSNTAR